MDTSLWRIHAATLLGIILTQVFYAASALGSRVTTLIALERSCCVVFSLQVKRIFTVRLVYLSILLFFLAQVVASVFYYRTFYMLEVPIHGSNRSQLVGFMTPENMELSNTIRFASYSVPTLICFTLVVIATVTLIRSLRKNQTARKAMKSSGTTISSERTESKTVKCVIFVCIIYIVGYSVNTFKRFVALAIPNLHDYDPQLGNITKVIVNIALVLQAISCSVNIFVYFIVNSKYRASLLKVFKLLSLSAGRIGIQQDKRKQQLPSTTSVSPDS